MSDERKCINYSQCKGYAEPGRDRCSCCIAADDEIRAAQDAKRLQELERKPRSLRDVWGRE